MCRNVLLYRMYVLSHPRGTLWGYNFCTDILPVTPDQVEEMGEYAHIYMTKDGRISMAGLNEHNIQVCLSAIKRSCCISVRGLTRSIVLCREHVQVRQG